jgi:general secretion pathway protein L
MKTVGIDIGSNQIKVVEINATTRGFQIANYHVLQLKHGGAQDVDLEVIDFLRGIVSKIDLEQTKFVLGIRQDKVAVRFRTFPFTEKNKISKTLPLDLEDELPFSVDNSVLDFKMIRTRGSEAEILACATPRPNVEKLVSFFKDTGAELDILCPEGFAFANLIEDFDGVIPNEPARPPTLDSELDAQIKREVEIILHLGHSRTLVSAFENKRLVSLRSLFWGGQNVFQAIAAKYQLPLPEAQKEMELKAFILNTKQQASFEAKVFSDTISQAVREMTRDLQLSLLEIKTELQCEIKSVQTTGGVSHIQGLGAFLTQMLELPVNKVKLWERFGQTLFENNEALESRLSVALGLALEGLKKPRNPAVNFLRGDFSNKPSRLATFWEDYGLSVAWSAALIVAVIVWASLRAGYADRLAQASNDVLKNQAKKVAKLTGKNVNEKGVKKYISEKHKVAVEMETVSKLMKVNTAFDILKKVSEMSPASSQLRLDVRRFYVQDQRVWMEGFVRSPLESTLLLNSLKALAVDGKINKQSPSIRGPADKTVFAFTFNVDRGLGKE